MKKMFALAAIAAMFIACGEKPEPQPQPQPGPGTGEGDTYVAPITIDGQFADWNALDASKVASATLPTGTVKHDGLNTLKVYADESFIYVYFEFNDEVIADKSWVPFHLYFNTDNDTTTGGGADEWGEPYCCDWMCEATIFDGGTFCSWDLGLFPWGGAAGESGWSWDATPESEPSDADAWGALIESGNGCSSGAGAGNAYEIAITKEMLPVEWADTFTVGADIQQEWTTCGFLPQAEATDENPNGHIELLTVTTVK